MSDFRRGSARSLPASAYELGHVPALDGLRGVAVAGVLAFHGDYLAGGFLGVDLFFVLSGFLITSLLLQEHAGTGTIGLGHFWARRARRLLPALFGLLVGVAIYVVVWAKPYEVDAIRSAALATLLYVANWQAIWEANGYWRLFTTPSPLKHTWSLAIEEQFYLVWPLVVLGVLRLRRATRGGGAAAVLAVALTLAIASSLWMMIRVVPGGDPSRVYYGTDTRAASILFGAALGAWLSWRGSVRDGAPRWILEAVALAAVAWLAFAWATIDGQGTLLYRGGLTLCGLAVAAVIAACVHPTRGPLAAIFSPPPLRWLGLISYGLYLWHWPVLVALRLEQTRVGISRGSLFGVQLAVSFALALGSFFLLEQPIRRDGLRAWGRRGRALVPAAAAAVVVLILAVTAGGEARPDFAAHRSGALGAANDPAFDDAPPPRSGNAPDAHSPGERAGASGAAAGPIRRPAGRTPRLLIVGDSVADALAEGIMRQRDLAVYAANMTLANCTLGREYGEWRRQRDVVEPEDPHCRQWPQLWTTAVRRFVPDAVLLLFGGPPQGSLRIGDAWFAPCTKEYRAYQRGELEAAIEILTAGGATLFIAPAAHPRFPFLPTDIDQRTDCVNDVYREAAADHPDVVRILGLDAWTCPPPGKDCVEHVEGITLREDGIHYSGAGADVAARWVVGEIFASRAP